MKKLEKLIKKLEKGKEEKRKKMLYWARQLERNEETNELRRE